MTEPTRDITPGIRRPPAPGSESAGPPVGELIQLLHRNALGLESLYRQAQSEARERCIHGSASFNSDGNGDGTVGLFAVPGGATGYLMHLAIDQEGSTPAAPNSNATLWHAIYAGTGAGITDPTKVVAQGALLDCSPSSPLTDAQIPYVYLYGDRYGAPSLVGPGAFYFVVDGALANRRHSLRFNIVISQPEP